MSKIQNEQADAIVVSPKVLERAFNIGERRVRQLAQENILVKSGRGRYLFIDSVSNYITHLKANNDIKNNVEESEIDYDEEKAKHEKAKRIKAELELRKIENSLHEAADVEAVMTDMIYNFRAKILAIPSMLAPALANEHDLNVVNRLLKDTLQQALVELADYDSDMFIEEDDENGSSQ